MKHILTAIGLIWSVLLFAQVGVGTAPPEEAIVLFDGTREMLDEKWEYWDGPRFRAEPPIKWTIVADPVDRGTVLNGYDAASEGALYGAADIVTKQKFRDFRLHVEFFIPHKGGNSGVYLQNRYEIQILDSDATKHGMATVINETASPYFAYNGTGSWNAYDIRFRAARFENGEKVEPARVTVFFNGIRVHQNVDIHKVWGGPASGLDGGNEGGTGITDTPGGIKLQAEGHEILFRNIWIIPEEIKARNTDFNPYAKD